MKKLVTPLILVAMLCITFTATSFAAGAAVPEDGSLLDLLTPIWDAFTGKHWWLAGAAALVAGVTLFKKYAPSGKARDFANSEEGAASLVLAGSFGAALVASLSGATAVPMSPALALDAFHVAAAAAGGYFLISMLVVKRLTNSKFYQDKAPSWLKAAVSLAFWAFQKKSPAIDTAKAAGEAAVAAKPATGAAGVVPPPTDV